MRRFPTDYDIDETNRSSVKRNTMLSLNTVRKKTYISWHTCLLKETSIESSIRADNSGWVANHT